jgi:bacterioferritin-associated ferredoxin
MYACLCRGVTEEQVRDVGSLGITAPGDLIELLRLDDDRCCGRCVMAIDQFVDLAVEGAACAPATAILVKRSRDS